MPEPHYTILITSVEPWGDVWYSKQHYAAQLAAQGHDVYFVNGPQNWRPTDIFSFAVRQRTTPEGIRVLSYRNNLPVRGIPRLMLRINDWLNSRKLRKHVRQQGHPPSQGGILWCFDPTRFIHYGPLRQAGFRHIYHVVDPYQHHFTDALLAKATHLLVAINSWYYRYYAQFSPHRLLIPHGIRPADRSYDAPVVAALRAQWGRYLFFPASLTNAVNYKLLRQVALRFPQYRLLMVGPKYALNAQQQQALDSLLALPNVTYDGAKHPNDMRNYVRGAVAGLVAYDFETRESEPSSAGRTPLKALTYLTQHCPVVATNNSYIPALDGKGYYKADNEDQFMALLQDVLDGKLGVDGPAVDAYFDTVEYQTLIAKILAALDQATGGPPTAR